MTEEVEVQDGVLKQLLGNPDLWNFQDSEDQKEVLQMILDAEVKIRRVPVDLAEADPQIKIAQIEAAREAQLAQIAADTQVRMVAEQAKAAHRWRSQLVMAVALLLLFAAFVHNNQPLIGSALNHDTQTYHSEVP